MLQTEVELKMEMFSTERNQCIDASLTMQLDLEQCVAFQRVDGNTDHHSTHHASFIVSNHSVVAARHPPQLCYLKGHIKAVGKSIVT